MKVVILGPNHGQVKTNHYYITALHCYESVLLSLLESLRQSHPQENVLALPSEQKGTQHMNTPLSWLLKAIRSHLNLSMAIAFLLVHNTCGGSNRIADLLLHFQSFSSSCSCRRRFFCSTSVLQELIWRFPKVGVPPNHPYSNGFSIINPSIWGYPHLWTPPYCNMMSGCPSWSQPFRPCGCCGLQVLRDPCWPARK